MVLGTAHFAKFSTLAHPSLVITVIVTAVVLTGDWLGQAVVQAARASRAAEGLNVGVPAWLVGAGSVVHLLFLWAATTISVDKPWGKAKRGHRVRSTAARESPQYREA